jgi:hypothetical protein
LNVKINADGYSDKVFTAEIITKAKAILQNVMQQEAEVLALMEA